MRVRPRQPVHSGVAIGLASIALLGSGGCAEETPPDALGEPPCDELVAPPPVRDGNLVLVVNDTMRRDFPGAYGGPARTPRFDAFAGESLLFERAATQAPWTKPSVATLFTSLYPSQHRVASHPQLRGVARGEQADAAVEADVLAPSLETLAEVLRADGMRTAAFVANPWMVRPFGFDQGFDTFDDSFARWGAGGEAVVDAGLAWLRSLARGDRYFLYLHVIDSHRPYGRLPTEDLERTRRTLNLGRALASADGRAIAASVRLDDGRRAVDAGFLPTDALVRAAYQHGVEEFDAVFGRLLDALAVRDDWDETALVVTSDHGEALFARGYGNHGLGLFDDEAAVPLVARLPGVAPAQGRISCLVGLVDLMPSLCRYFGATCPDAAQGWSFLRAAGTTGPAPPARRYLVTEGVMRAPGQRSIRNRRYKLVYRPDAPTEAPPATTDRRADYALFDLEADPEERANRLAQGYEPPEIRSAYEAFRTALPGAVAAVPPPEERAAEMDPAVRDRLEAIGYTE